MRFAYYQNLSLAERRVYRQSDAIGSIELPETERLKLRVREIEVALEGGKRAEVERACQGLASAMTAALGVGPVTVRVLAKRPRAHDGELHGLYTCDEEDRATIEVWMKTAEHRRTVAFRTFLRTLLHELCHHFDFFHLKLTETYHTHGFFRRESSLFRQLVNARPKARTKTAEPSAAKSAAKSARSPERGEQLSLFG